MERDGNAFLFLVHRKEGARENDSVCVDSFRYGIRMFL